MDGLGEKGFISFWKEEALVAAPAFSLSLQNILFLTKAPGGTGSSINQSQKILQHPDQNGWRRAAFVFAKVSVTALAPGHPLGAEI